MALTPATISILDTPPAPRHAGEDSRHYSTRRSTRHSNKRALRAAQTPPSDADDLQPRSNTSRLHRLPSPHSSGTLPHSPPSSTHASPPKRVTKGRKPKMPHYIDGTDNSELTADNNDPIHGKQGASAPYMLPTPASLPRKKQISRKETEAAARILFPPKPDTVEDAMPTPRKNRKGRAGFSLYSPNEAGGAGSEGEVQIYTDSRDKVPSLDLSEDNPFVDRPQQNLPSAESARRNVSRKRKQRHVETHPEIERAFECDDGIVYVFRGKKVYRPFPKDSESEREDSPTAANGDADALNDPEISRLRPLTRSLIKPKLLFPTTQQQAERNAAALAAEEAPTDIEDHSKQQPKEIVTPVKKSFEMATPPTTGHATRSTTTRARDTASPKDRDMEDAGMYLPGGKKKVSPFNGWARTKAGAPRRRKRDAEAMEKDDGEDAKRREVMR